MHRCTADRETIALVTLLVAALIVLVVTTVAVATMLLVRRGAPAGSYFADGDRAAGVFGVLATGFAVLVGFVVFLAFESFDTSRSGAETEAQVVSQQFETAQFMPVRVRKALSGELVCYAREVVHSEWPAMGRGKLGDLANPWSVAMFRTMQTVDPKSASEQAAYAKWFDQRSDRESARSDRAHGAEGVIPTPLWIVLFISALALFAFMLLFADSDEAAFVQGAMIAAVAVVTTSTLLLLWFLDNPYHSGVGSLRPTAMARTLDRLDAIAPLVGGFGTLPCDAHGAAGG
jgi:amino acid transporter